MPLSDTLKSRLAQLTGARFSPNLPRIVIDTNVLLDLLFWKNPTAAPLAEALQENRLVAIFDDEALWEAAEVLGRPAFLADDELIFARLAAWAEQAERVPIEAIDARRETLSVRCRDPLDQKFLTLAVAGNARWLATKDKLLFKAGKKLRRFGTEPVRPTEFDVFKTDPFCGPHPKS